jgi:hypothetical protein
VEGELVRDLLGPEGAGVFPFIEQFDPADADPVVIEVEFLGLIHRVAELDSLADVGGGDFIDRALETDGGVIIDDPFVADEKDLIQFGLG